MMDRVRLLLCCAVMQEATVNLTIQSYGNDGRVLRPNYPSACVYQVQWEHVAFPSVFFQYRATMGTFLQSSAQEDPNFQRIMGQHIVALGVVKLLLFL